MSFEEVLLHETKKEVISPLDIVLINSYDVYSSPDLAVKIEYNGNFFNHIGIIINSSILPEYCPDSDKTYVIESTFNSTLWSKGMRVVSLNHLMKNSKSPNTIRLFQLDERNPWKNSSFIGKNKIKAIIRAILTPEMSSMTSTGYGRFLNPFYGLNSLYTLFYYMYSGIGKMLGYNKEEKSAVSSVVAQILHALGTYNIISDAKII